jgi:predicted permease
MILVLSQMAVLIACGTLWNKLAPNHITALSHRRAITDLVFYILLPALVLDVIWSAPLDSSSYQISLLATTGLATGMLAMWLVLRFVDTTPAQKGALLLAAAFPNVTYLGLPVMNQVQGAWTNAIILQYDLFACTPMLMTVGMLMSRHYGAPELKLHPLRELAKIPPLWAVLIAMVLNFSGSEQPAVIHGALSVLSGAVVPLMLIVLGMSIRWDSLRLRFMPLLLPVVMISLLLVPTALYWLTPLSSLTPAVQTTVILASAMPTMVFGIVICERYRLDSALYAAAVAMTTLLSVASLSFWAQLVV